MGELVEAAVLDMARDRRLRKLYGITIAQYEATLAQQGGGCAGCGKRPKPGGRRLHCDHDHKTGKFRGVLCWGCNTTLKKLKDDPEIAYALYMYLKRAQREQP